MQVADYLKSGFNQAQAEILAARDAEKVSSAAPPAAAAVPPAAPAASKTHAAACGVVGETGAHGDLGSNAIDYKPPQPAA